MYGRTQQLHHLLKYKLQQNLFHVTINNERNNDKASKQHSPNKNAMFSIVYLGKTGMDRMGRIAEIVLHTMTYRYSCNFTRTSLRYIRVFTVRYRNSVCLSSVTFVRPTQPVEIFGNV